MAAKKHDEDRGVDLEGQERIAELDQSGTDIPHGPHSGELATEKQHDERARVVSGDPGNWHDPADDQTSREEFGRTAEIDKNKIGSKRGFNTSSEREHDPGNESYEHTGSDNREGMGSGTEAGPAHQGRVKP